ncbi:hypothetical protein AgCh_005056 [Apium graveolens]
MIQRRWLELIKDYDCSINYHPGKANVVADALSKKERLNEIKIAEELAKELEKLEIEVRTLEDNKDYHASIGMSPYKALYGRSLVLLKVSPWKGLVRFGQTGKLSPRYIGPFEVLRKVGKVAYELALPLQLQHIHNLFRISMLKCYILNLNQVIEYEPIELQPDLSCMERPIQILDRKERVLSNKSIPIVKVLWRNPRVEESTWELESDLLLLEIKDLFEDLVLELWVLPPNFIKLAKDVYMPDFIAASDCMLEEFLGVKSLVHVNLVLTCVVLQFAGKRGVAGNGDRRRGVGKMAKMPFDPPGQRQKGVIARSVFFRPGGPLASELAKHPVILKVNDWLFCHGGLLPYHAAYGIERLNKELAARPRSPESLQYLVEIARNPSSSATGLSGLVSGKEDNLRHSRNRKQTTGLSAATREEYYLLDSVEPDPVGFRNQVFVKANKSRAYFKRFQVKFKRMRGKCHAFSISRDHEESEETGEDYSVEPAESRRPFRGLLDDGLLRTTTGNRIFGALKV